MNDRFGDLPVKAKQYIKILEDQVEWLETELEKSERILIQKTQEHNDNRHQNPWTPGDEETPNVDLQDLDILGNTYPDTPLSIADACEEVKRKYEKYGDYFNDPVSPEAGVRVAERKALQQGDIKQPSPEVEEKYRQILELYQKGVLPPRLEDHVRRAERHGDCKRILVDMMERRNVI